MKPDPTTWHGLPVKMGKRLRISVPEPDLAKWYAIGWGYVMPDFDNKDHAVIDWPHEKPPVKPFELGTP